MLLLPLAQDWHKIDKYAYFCSLYLQVWLLAKSEHVRSMSLVEGTLVVTIMKVILWSTFWTLFCPHRKTMDAHLHPCRINISSCCKLTKSKSSSPSCCGHVEDVQIACGSWSLSCFQLDGINLPLAFPWQLSCVGLYLTSIDLSCAACMHIFSWALLPSCQRQFHLIRT